MQRAPYVLDFPIFIIFLCVHLLHRRYCTWPPLFLGMREEREKERWERAREKRSEVFYLFCFFLHNIAAIHFTFKPSFVHFDMDACPIVLSALYTECSPSPFPLTEALGSPRKREWEKETNRTRVPDPELHALRPSLPVNAFAILPPCHPAIGILVHPHPFISRAKALPVHGHLPLLSSSASFDNV